MVEINQRNIWNMQMSQLIWQLYAPDSNVKCGNNVLGQSVKSATMQMYCDFGKSFACFQFALWDIKQRKMSRKMRRNGRITCKRSRRNRVKSRVRVDQINRKGLKLKLKFEWVDFGQQLSTQSAKPANKLGQMCCENAAENWISWNRVGQNL